MMSELVNFLTTHEEQFRRARLGALYSDFRHLQTLNADGYAANVEAWQKGLENAAKRGYLSSRGSSVDLLVLKVGEELLRALETREWGRPLALGTVLREGIANKELIPINEFMAAKESIYNKSWAVAPWQIFSWGLRQLGLSGGEPGEDQLRVDKLVILSNVEEASKELLLRARRHTSRVDRLFSKELFSDEFRHVINDEHPMSQQDLEVLLKFMARDKKVLLYDGQTVKLKGPEDTGASSITPEDTTIASLKTLLADLERQTVFLSKRIESFTIAAHDAVACKNRVAALAALRSKKLAESNLFRRSQILGQLEEVYAKIEQAVDQVELFHIMEGSTGVLKALHKEIGGIERVDKVVDQLNEQMNQVDDIGKVISEAGHSTGVVVENEVDDELRAIELEDQEKRVAAEKLMEDDKEARDTAEVKLKLESLSEVERNASTVRLEGESRRHPVQSPVEESARALERMSL